MTTVPEASFHFRYETHLHTREGSACGLDTAACMVDAYIAAGYAGVIVTDHFFNGNCAVSVDLPWAKKVAEFCKGYDQALAAVQGRPFTVFFGWEYNYQGTEFLTYGLDRRFLLDHADILAWDVRTYLQTVRQSGGLVSQAHPFRQREYIREIRLFPEDVDAVEVYNPGNHPDWNAQAVRLAEANGLASTVGSDAHSARVSEATAAAMAFDHRLTSVADFITSVKNHAYRIIRPPVHPAC